MAIITTGNVELLRVLFDKVDETFSPIDSFRNLLAKALGSETESTERSSSQIVLHQQDGGEATLTGDFSATTSSRWKINGLSYKSAEGPILRTIGRIKLTDEGSFNTAELTEISVTDVNLTLDPSGRQTIVTFTGITTVSVANGVISSHVLIKNITKVFSNGYTLFQEAINGLKDYDSQAPMKSNAAIIDTASGKIILKLDNMRDSQNINLETVDDFIAFHLMGNDLIIGTADADFLYSGAGNDTVNAGVGDDLIVGGDGSGNDTYDGGKGIDTVKYTSSTAPITVNLTKGTAASTGKNDAAGIGADKLKNVENIIAGDYADILTGSKYANRIEGCDGNDTIDGRLGNDTLIGGSGADRFVFSTKPAPGNVYTLSDFEPGIDKIVISGKVFAKLKLVQDVSPYFAIDVAGAAQHYLVYQTSTGTLFYDADGSGSGKAVEIAVVGAGTALLASDIAVA